MTKWLENEELFQREVRQGHHWERWVAMFFVLNGLSCKVQEQTVRENVEDRHEYAGTTDLELEGLPVEVKTTRFAWTDRRCPDPLYVMSTHKWEKMDPKPFAVVLVCKGDGTIRALPGAVVPKLPTREVHDRVRDVKYTAYLARKDQWRTVDRLMESVRNSTGGEKPDAPAREGSDGDVTEQGDADRQSG